jgi:hypothetical protein
LAYEITDHNYNIKYGLAFSPKMFMQCVTSNKLNMGDILIFDEAGVGLSSKEWYTVQNRLLNSVLQTFRHKNIGVIFTTPSLSFMDKTARILTHTYMETNYIDDKNKICNLRVYKFEHNSMLDKTYKKFYVFHLGDDQASYSMPEIALGLPPKDLIEAYEEKKNKYTRELNKNVYQEILNEENKKKEYNSRPCSQCNNKAFYFRKKTQSWLCKKCGKETKTNPYK